MAKKEFKYRGKTLQELLSLSLEEFIELIPSRQRRTIQRMMKGAEDNPQLKLYKAIKKALAKGQKDSIRTHVRDFVILPEMVGMTIMVHNGKEFVRLDVKDKMVGHLLGEFALTRKMITHSSPGIGATKSTKFVSVRA